MAFDQNVIEALARLRHAAAHSDDISNPLARAFQALDNAGVFAALDEQTDYASATEILAESAVMEVSGRMEAERDRRRSAEAVRASVPNTADPAEWGDTTSADMAQHQGIEFSDTHPRAAHELGELISGTYGDRLISTDGEDLTDAYSAQEPFTD